LRNHQVAWLGCTEAADLEAAYGIALDTDFYHWGNWLQKPDSTWPHGYITGSGQPMKFIRADGTILPVYQQLTELVDEQLMGISSAESLSTEQALAVSQQLIDASQDGDYAALMTQFHVDYYHDWQAQPWAEGTMAYANSLGIPIWNADRWLDFTETRHDATFSDVVWSSVDKTLTFNLSATATTGISLTTMVPLTYSGQALQLASVDGQPAAYGVQTISGETVAFVTVPSGDHAFTVLYGDPTAVKLASFTASRRAGATVVEWETATEIDNLGFNLYRTNASNVLPGPGEKLNEALIPSQSPGDLWGASYTYPDETAAAVITSYYWLEAIDNKGVAELYGPVAPVAAIDTISLPGKVFLPIVCK
jgi:hypothetical protein